MSESLIQVTEGAGKKIHTDAKSIGGNTVEDTYQVPGEYPLPTYVVVAGAISGATSGDHLVSISAPAALKLRIRRIRIEQANNATAAAIATLQVLRIGAVAPAGGSVINASAFEQADGATSASIRTLPTTKGTEGTELMRTTLVVRQAVAPTGAQMDESWEWTQLPNCKPIVVPAGALNGIVIKNSSSIAGVTYNVIVEYVESAY